MATGTKELSASLEDYLETIYHIQAKKQAARAKDISDRMHVNRSSVTGALQSLSEKGMVNYAPYDIITLTPEGKAAAEDVVRRHEVMKDFFVKVLAVDEAEAEDAACKMEHSIPRSILEKFVEFVDFVGTCPRSGAEWIEKFMAFCRHGNTQEHCEQCVSDCLEGITTRRKAKDSGGGATTVSAAELGIGRRGRITSIVGQGRNCRRLRDIGATEGTVLEVEEIGPAGDPVEVKVKGYHFTLTPVEAASILVEAR